MKLTFYDPILGEVQVPAFVGCNNNEMPCTREVLVSDVISYNV